MELGGGDGSVKHGEACLLFMSMKFSLKVFFFCAETISKKTDKFFFITNPQN